MIIRQASQLMVLAALFLASCATAPKQGEGPSMLLVRNESAAACELFVERGYFGTIPAATRLLVRNLPASPWRLELACPEPLVRQVVDPETDTEVAVPGDETVADRTALLAVRNPTPFDVDLYLDFIRLGGIPSGTDSLFAEVPAGPATLTFQESGGTAHWTQEANLVSGAVSTVEAAAPVAVLTVTNDGGEAVEVAVRDRVASLAASQATRLEGLPAGPTLLEIRYPASGRTAQTRVDLDPGVESAVSLSGSTGNLAVENRLREPVALLLSGEEVARVEPGSSKQILGLASGNATLRAVGDSGRVIEETFLIVPDSTEAWVIEDGQGQVLVRNHVGESIRLFVDGRLMAEMLPLSALRFPLAAGQHQVQAGCVLCNHVASMTVDVMGGVMSEVVIGPQPGRLVLHNGTAETLTFHRNGRPLSRVGPGMRVELAGQPLGRHLVEVLTEGGALVKRETVEIVPREQGTAIVDVGETALIVRIRNSTGEAVRVFPELSPEPPEIPVGTEGFARLPGVSGVVKIRGVVTGNRYDRQVAGEAGTEIRVDLAAVSTGAMVENRTARSLELLLDGTSVAVLEPSGTYVQDRVAPGRHRFEARAGEKRFDEVAFDLRGGGWYAWRLVEKLGSLQVHNQTPEELEILVDGAVAGFLPEGGVTLLAELPLRATTATARSSASGRFHALTFTPQAGGKVEWVVRSESGGVLFQGLSGIGGTVFVDGEEVCRIPVDAPDPRPVPLSPGAHLLKVALPDGSARTGAVQVSPSLYIPFLASGGDPEVELRNRTADRLILTIDGLPGGEVAAGATLEILLSGPGTHTVHATTSDGTGSWRLENVPFKTGARFGWTVGE